MFVYYSTSVLICKGVNGSFFTRYNIDHIGKILYNCRYRQEVFILSKYDEITNYLPDTSFAREDILTAAYNADPSFSDSSLRRLIDRLKASGLIVHVARDVYTKPSKNDSNLSDYVCDYSDKAKAIIDYMQGKFPRLRFVVWETSALNEFTGHLLARNYIMLEVENSGCEFVFDGIKHDFELNTLLRPTQKELLRYGENDTVIVDRLITESPTGTSEKYALTLEKLIVDMFSNRTLKEILSRGDYAEAISDMFSKYRINVVKLLRYARRRNKEETVVAFFESINLKHLIVK